MFLWLGVVATLLGMLLELSLLPFRLDPNQTALMYVYQDFTVGILVSAPPRKGSCYRSVGAINGGRVDSRWHWSLHVAMICRGDDS